MTAPGETSVAAPATGDSSRRRRSWRRRILAVATALCFLFGVRLAVVYYQHMRQQQLIAVVRNAGGKVREPKSLLWRAQYWYDYGEFPRRSVGVNLNEADSDPIWLREHDWLRGLDLQMLASFENKVTGTDLARLIDAHPLEQLYVDDIELTDEIVAALQRKSSLEELSIVSCTLSDAQFTDLPLEQLRYLTVAQATVSSARLLQLRRCKGLTTLSLDGRQFTPEVAEVLASLGTVKNLLLCGDEVTDEHLELVKSIESLKRLSFYFVDLTPESVGALQAALPDCEVEPP